MVSVFISDDKHNTNKNDSTKKLTKPEVGCTASSVQISNKPSGMAPTCQSIGHTVNYAQLGALKSSELVRK